MSSPRTRIGSRRAFPRLVLVSALTVASLAAGTSTAEAEPVPPGQELHVSSVGSFQNPNNNTVFGLYVSPATSGGDLAANGTVLSLATHSCGSHLATATKVVSYANGYGAVVNYNDAQVKKVGRSIEYVLTITQEGYDSYTRESSYSGYTVKRPTCEELQNPLRPTWSTKKATATIVGQRISVTPTIASGAEVSYAWKLRNSYGRVMGKAVGTRRSIRLKSAWVGRGIGIIIKVRKPGYQQQSKTIVFLKVSAKH